MHVWRIGLSDIQKKKKVNVAQKISHENVHSIRINISTDTM